MQAVQCNKGLPSLDRYPLRPRVSVARGAPRHRASRALSSRLRVARMRSETAPMAQTRALCGDLAPVGSRWPAVRAHMRASRDVHHRYGLCSSAVPTLMRALTSPSQITAGAPFGEAVRVLVADDFPLIREAHAAALRRRQEIEVVGVAEDGEEALEMARALRPDVAVLDLR